MRVAEPAEGTVGFWQPSRQVSTFEHVFGGLIIQVFYRVSEGHGLQHCRHQAVDLGPVIH